MVRIGQFEKDYEQFQVKTFPLRGNDALSMEMMVHMATERDNTQLFFKT